MISVYKLVDKDGKIYVGSTSRELRTRKIEHKSQAKYDFDYENCKIHLLEECSIENRFDVENFWIKKLKSINKAMASTGPVGFKQTDKAKRISSKTMKNVHKNNPEAIARARAKSLTPEKQRERSILAQKSRWAKMTPWFAKCRKTGDIFGPYKGNFAASKELGLHDSTIIRCLKKKMTSSKYEMFYENAEAALSL